MFCKNCNKKLLNSRKYFCDLECRKEYYKKLNKKNNFKKCPICKKEFKFKGHGIKVKKFCSKKCYGISILNKESNFKGKHHSKESRQKLSSSHKGQFVSEDTKIKLSLIGKGRKFSEEHRNKIKTSLTGLKRNSEARANMRLARIKYIEKIKLSGLKLCPSSNLRACEYFKRFDEENNTKGQYALYGDGEFFIKQLGFWVDYINPDLKLIMEYDEKSHYLADGTLKEKDKKRQKDIEKLYSDYKFVRIKEANL
jgi:hypothetical protein